MSLKLENLDTLNALPSLGTDASVTLQVLVGGGLRKFGA